MKNIEIMSGQFATVLDNELAQLYTINLNNDFALVIKSPVQHSITLARGLRDVLALGTLLSSITKDHLPEECLDVQIIGGDTSDLAKQRYFQLFNALNDVDNGRNIINIIAADVLEKPHPNSFSINTISQHVEPYLNTGYMLV